MNSSQLDQDEQQLLDAYNSEEFQSDMTPERKYFIEQSAAQTFKNNKKINLIISEHDFLAIQRKALEEGMSYQALITSILHKYISGSLYDAIANKANPADTRTSHG
jgi:predicted DNA binding CopG/RHH family protein